MATTATVFLSVPAAAHHLPVCQRGGFNGQTVSFTKSAAIKTVPVFSSSSSASASSVTVEDEGSPRPLTDGIPVQSQSTDPNALPRTRGCKACGREEVENGCNGEGRIQGGIASFPGFGWWPIKAYRPCPGFVASGGRYRRRGQSMDEVVSGRGKTPLGTTNDN